MLQIRELHSADVERDGCEEDYRTSVEQRKRRTGCASPRNADASQFKKQRALHRMLTSPCQLGCWSGSKAMPASNLALPTRWRPPTTRSCDLHRRRRSSLTAGNLCAATRAQGPVAVTPPRAQGPANHASFCAPNEFGTVPRLWVSLFLSSSSKASPSGSEPIFGGEAIR
jgi:hypothetical protein